MTGTINLTGRWTGVYFYPADQTLNANDNMPATPFTAALIDAGGVITGTTLEPDTLGGPGAPDIPAIVDGSHDGALLTFTKFPEGGGHDDPIVYSGLITPDGDSVTGDWSIPGAWSGTFRMQRCTVSETAAEDAAADTRA